MTGSDSTPLLALREKAAAEYATHQERQLAADGLIPVQDEITALASSCTYLAEYQPALVPGRLRSSTSPAGSSCTSWARRPCTPASAR